MARAKVAPNIVLKIKLSSYRFKENLHNEKFLNGKWRRTFGYLRFCNISPSYGTQLEATTKNAWITICCRNFPMLNLVFPYYGDIVLSKNQLCLDFSVQKWRPTRVTTVSCFTFRNVDKFELKMLTSWRNGHTIFIVIPIRPFTALNSFWRGEND